MSNGLPPNRLVQWVLLCASAVPMLAGVIDVRTVTGPGDQKMSAGIGLAFVCIPLSLLFAIILAIMTCASKHLWQVPPQGSRATCFEASDML